MLIPDAEHMDLTGPLNEFAEQGYARLGPILSEEGARLLGARAEAMMDGTIHDPRLFFQHDSESGLYEDLVFDAGWVGPSPNYRKLERIELDPLFCSWIENPLFERIAKALLGDHVALYRCVLWNKAPRRGMSVPWHQDDGKFWGLDRAPFLQVWTALDDATVEAGCLEVLPGSHRAGLASPQGGTVTPESQEAASAKTNALALPVRRGESILVHNHLWHRTGRNHTAAKRRAVSVSYLGGDVRCTRRRRAPRSFRRVFEQPRE